MSLRRTLGVAALFLMLSLGAWAVIRSMAVNTVPAPWHARFAALTNDAERRAGGDARPWALNRVMGFTRQDLPRVIVLSECSESLPRVGRQEIWVADIAGSEAVRLVDEPKMVISGIAPSPGGTRIAYAARPDNARTLADSWAASRINVADSTGECMVAASGGAVAPAWSADGRSLLFLRRVEGGWQPQCIEVSVPARIASATRIVAGVILTAPAEPTPPVAQFSPDGRSVAGFRDGELVVARLDDGSPPRSFPSITGRPISLSWSPDSVWIRLSLDLDGPLLTVSRDLALRVADGRQVNLAEAMVSMVEPRETEVVRIISAVWMPGPKCRLLALAHSVEASSDLLPSEAEVGGPGRKPRWLICEVDAATTSRVDGPPIELPNPSDPLQIFLTLDGRHIGAGHLLCPISIANN